MFFFGDLSGLEKFLQQVPFFVFLCSAMMVLLLIDYPGCQLTAVAVTEDFLPGTHLLSVK